jgi:pimeloyl-ACP methyl ester carboxylesterase
MDHQAWAAVRAAMEAQGHRTLAVNLPGRPANPAAPATMSLNLYRDAVLAAIAAEARPVILVGHSFGGITISTVAEAAPAKVAALVYVEPSRVCRRLFGLSYAAIADVSIMA